MKPALPPPVLYLCCGAAPCLGMFLILGRRIRNRRLAPDFKRSGVVNLLNLGCRFLLTIFQAALDPALPPPVLYLCVVPMNTCRSGVSRWQWSVKTGSASFQVQRPF